MNIKEQPQSIIIVTSSCRPFILKRAYLIEKPDKKLRTNYSLTAEVFRELQFISSKLTDYTGMIRFLVFSVILITLCTSDPAPDEKCRFVKNTMLTCLDSTAGDLPTAVNNEVEWIMFTRSNVPVLKKKHLENFPKVTDLHLKDTNLETIEDDAFFESKSLNWVDVSVNKLTTISPGLFQTCPDMYYFNISHNPDLVIPKNEPFLIAPKLRWLVMENSAIKELYSETFNMLPRLKYLSLARNELTALPGDIFQPLSHLISLDLSGNHFKTLNLQMDSVGTMALYLGDNPWECDCSLFPTMEWAKTQKLKDEVRCKTPENLNWQDISSMNCPQIAAH